MICGKRPRCWVSFLSVLSPPKEYYQAKFDKFWSEDTDRSKTNDSTDRGEILQRSPWCQRNCWWPGRCGSCCCCCCHCPAACRPGPPRGVLPPGSSEWWDPQETGTSRSTSHGCLSGPRWARSADCCFLCAGPWMSSHCRGLRGGKKGKKKVRSERNLIHAKRKRFEFWMTYCLQHQRQAGARQSCHSFSPARQTECGNWMDVRAGASFGTVSTLKMGPANFQESRRKELYLDHDKTEYRTRTRSDASNTRPVTEHSYVPSPSSCTLTHRHTQSAKLHMPCTQTRRAQTVALTPVVP